MTDSIKKFITDIVEKPDENKRTYLTSSLYNLLGQNIFHQNLTAFAHDFSEDVEVGFFELGFKRNTFVENHTYQLMFKENEMSAKNTINKDQFGGTFKKILGHHGNKLTYISKKEDDKDNMIAMVIFAELEKENEIEGFYILQLKTKADHYVGVGDSGVQKYRGNGIGRFLIEMVKCYTYGVSTKSKSDVVLKTSSKMNQKFFKHIGFHEMGIGENLLELIREFDSKFKFFIRENIKLIIFLMIQKSRTWRLLMQEKSCVYPIMM